MSKSLYLTIAIICISVQTSGKTVSRRDSSRGALAGANFASGLFRQEIAHLQRKIATQGQRLQLLENDNTGCKSQLNVLSWKIQNIDKKIETLQQKHQQDIANINTNCQCSSNQNGFALNQAAYSANQAGFALNQPPTQPSNSPNQPGHAVNQAGLAVNHPPHQPSHTPNQPIHNPNQPSHTPNQPIHNPNQPSHTPNQPINTPNHPGYSLNQPSNTPNQPDYALQPESRSGISGSLDYLHIEEEVGDSSSGWTQLVNGSYNYIRQAKQSPPSASTISPVVDRGQWVWSDSANKWEWKMFPGNLLKSLPLPNIPVLPHNDANLQQQQTQIQQQSQHQDQLQYQSQSQQQQQQQQQQNQHQHQQQQQQQQQQNQQQHQGQHQQHQNQHQQQVQNQVELPDLDLGSMIGDSDCCWYQLPNSTWAKKSSSWVRTVSNRKRVQVPSNRLGDGAEGADQPVESGSTDTGWKKLPNGSYMRQWSSWSSWSGGSAGKPCC